MTEHIATKVPQVMTTHYQIVDDCEGFSRLILSYPVDYTGQHIGAGNSQGLLDVLSLNLIARKTDDLIEGGLGVAHRAVPRARDFAHGFLGNRNLFGVGNEAQPLGNLGRGNRAKFKELESRADGSRD